jgi:RNA polymerase sigma factor (sigma-70 family)
VSRFSIVYRLPTLGRRKIPFEEGSRLTLRLTGSCEYKSEPEKERRVTAATDEQLLVASRADPAAFEEFYRRNVGVVVRFAARRSSSPGEVRDLVAAVWLQVVASIDRFDETKGSAAAWVLGIAAHLCATDVRRKKAETAAVRRLAGQRVLEQDDLERLEREIAAASVAREFLAAIAELPAAEREVAELSLVEGLSPGEASQALGVSAPAVRMRLARARRKLRQAVPAAEAVWTEEII